MRIDTLRSTTPALAKRAAQRAGGSGFSGLIESEPQTGAVSKGAPVFATAPLVFVDAQQIEDRQARPRKAEKQMAAGHDALDLLGQLQRALILGTTSVGLLQTLAARAEAQNGATDDPQLAGIMNEIKIRLAVETAKLEAAHSHGSVA